MGRRKKQNSSTKSNNSKTNNTLKIIIFIILIVIAVYEYMHSEENVVPDKVNYDISELGEFPDEGVIKEDELQVYFFDVGQADSILVVNKGQTMLIDAGNNEDRKITGWIY